MLAKEFLYNRPLVFNLNVLLWMIEIIYIYRYTDKIH